jgi:hypothetical protein
MDSTLPQENELMDLVLPGRAAKAGKPEQLGLLEEVLEKRQLEAYFQPILDLKSGEIIGYEGLIRGPVDTPLHAPVELFRFASKHGYACAWSACAARRCWKALRGSASPTNYSLTSGHSVWLCPAWAPLRRVSSSGAWVCRPSAL